jgi:hypothetical protein
MNDRQASSGIIKDKNMNGGKTNAACANRKHAAIFPWFRTKMYGNMLFVDAEKRYAVPYIAANTCIC